MASTSGRHLPSLPSMTKYFTQSAPQSTPQSAPTQSLNRQINNNNFTVHNTNPQPVSAPTYKGSHSVPQSNLSQQPSPKKGDGFSYDHPMTSLASYSPYMTANASRSNGPASSQPSVVAQPSVVDDFHIPADYSRLQYEQFLRLQQRNASNMSVNHPSSTVHHPSSTRPSRANQPTSTSTTSPTSTFDKSPHESHHSSSDIHHPSLMDSHPPLPPPGLDERQLRLSQDVYELKRIDMHITSELLISQSANYKLANEIYYLKYIIHNLPITLSTESITNIKVWILQQLEELNLLAPSPEQLLYTNQGDYESHVNKDEIKILKQKLQEIQELLQENDSTIHQQQMQLHLRHDDLCNAVHRFERMLRSVGIFLSSSTPGSGGQPTMGPTIGGRKEPMSFTVHNNHLKSSHDPDKASLPPLDDILTLTENDFFEFLNIFRRHYSLSESESNVEREKEFIKQKREFDKEKFEFENLKNVINKERQQQQEEQLEVSELKSEVSRLNSILKNKNNEIKDMTSKFEESLSQVSTLQQQYQSIKEKLHLQEKEYEVRVSDMNNEINLDTNEDVNTMIESVSKLPVEQQSNEFIKKLKLLYAANDKLKRKTDKMDKQCIHNYITQILPSLPPNINDILDGYILLKKENDTLFSNYTELGNKNNKLKQKIKEIHDHFEEVLNGQKARAIKMKKKQSELSQVVVTLQKTIEDLRSSFLNKKNETESNYANIKLDLSHLQEEHSILEDQIKKEKEIQKIDKDLIKNLKYEVEILTEEKNKLLEKQRNAEIVIPKFGKGRRTESGRNIIPDNDNVDGDPMVDQFHKGLTAVKPVTLKDVME